jgi:membrane associated rhomboid family serine protease
MLDDRFYMRSSETPPLRSATVWLLIVNVVVFFIQSLLDYYTPWHVMRYLALHPQLVFRGYVWQLFTYQFLHAGMLHLLVNSLVIYFFGRALEDDLGKSQFLRLYLLSGVAGGLLQATGGILFPVHFGAGAGTVGASAGAFGLVAAYATLYPERPLNLLLWFVLTVTIRAKYLLLFSGLLAFFGIMVPTDTVAHAAHLGGLITGILFVVLIIRPPEGLFHWGHRQPEAPPRELVKAPTVRKPVWHRQNQADQPGPPDSLSPDFISREVDPILDKISAKGIHSLTARERRILEEARNKMGKK